MSNAHLIVQKHPFSPVGQVTGAIPAGGTLHAWLTDNHPGYQAGADQPVIVRVNGQLLEPARWGKHVIAAGDEVVIAPRPFGWAAVVVAVIAAAYAYTQMPDMALGPNNYFDTPEQSPTYDLSAQGNSARLGQPVPAGYGLNWVYPDFAVKPFRRYIDGDQYLFHVLSLGQGINHISGREIGETPVANFDGFTDQVCQPGELVTLFHPDVLTSDEVRNVDLFAPNDNDYAGWTGAYVIAPVGSVCVGVEVDLVCPAGFYQQNPQNGELSAVSATIEIQTRQIDDADQPLGAWASMTHVISQTTVDPIRQTVALALTPGRYEIQVRRVTLSAAPDSLRLQDRVVFGELRAVLQSDATFDHAVWAVKIKVTGQLSAQSERKFRCQRQRWLPVWDGTQWTAPQATRNPAWAFCDVTKASYGGGNSDAFLDLAEIKRLADIWDARGDYFDYQFDTKNTLRRAQEIICRAGRAQPVEYSGVYSIVRDEPKTLPEYSFGMAEIVEGSFGIEYVTQDQWEFDGIEVEYIDPDSGLPAYRECVLPGSAGANLKKVKREGITDHAQAFREGMFDAARLAYRNRTVKFKTELDGGLPPYGALLAVSNELPEWGVSGSVLDVVVDGLTGDQTLTLSEPVQFEAGKNYVISLRSDRAKLQGPYVVSQGAGDREVVIAAGTNASAYTGWQKSKTSFAFGEADTFARNFIMRRASHSGGFQFELSGEYDDPRVHQIDADILGGVIPVPTPQAPVSAGLGQVSGVRTTYTGTLSEPVLNVTWNPVRNAEAYIIEISRDGGATWSALAKTVDLWARKPVAAGAAKIRIAAMAVAVGPWLVLDISAGSGGREPAVPSGLALAAAWEGLSVGIAWATSPDAMSWIVSACDAGGAVKRTVETDKPTFEYSYLDAQQDGLGRDITFKVWAVGESGEASLLPAELAVHNNQIGALGSVTVDSAVRSAVIQIDRPSNADFAGFRVWRGDTSDFVADSSNIIKSKTDERIFSIPLSANTQWIRVAGIDVWGDDGLTVSATYQVDKAAIDASDLADDSIPTEKIQSLAVDKIVGDVGAFVTLNVQNLDVSKLTGLASSWVTSNIQFASIGSAQIADELKSSNFGPATGWRILKTGAMELYEVTMRGALVGVTGTFAGALTAASGTFSGVLTASAVNAVDTINIAGQAVTIPVHASASSALVYSGADTGWRTVLSAAIYSTGAPIAVEAFVKALGSQHYSGGDPFGFWIRTVAVRLLRNGSTLVDGTVVAGAHSPAGYPERSGSTVLLSGDAVGVGWATYELQVSSGAGNGNWEVHNRTMVITEMKR